jgi:hypothetical protein
VAEANAFARDVAEAEGARRERERLLQELSVELGQYHELLSSAVIIDGLWGWVMWQRQKDKP